MSDGFNHRHERDRGDEIDPKPKLAILACNFLPILLKANRVRANLLHDPNTKVEKNIEEENEINEEINPPPEAKHSRCTR